MTIGQRLKQYRMKAGLTQQQLAEAIGLTQENVSQMENDHVGLTIDKLHKICEALGCTITDIIEQ